MRCCCGYLSGARCSLFAYIYMVQLMPLHFKHPSPLTSYKARLVLLLWYWLTQVVLEKRPLNRCSTSTLFSYLKPSNTGPYHAGNAGHVWRMAGHNPGSSAVWRQQNSFIKPKLQWRHLLSRTLTCSTVR